MSEYNWSIDYICKLSRGQIILFLNKITKRKQNEAEFQKAIHGHKTKNKGLNIEGAVDIEDIIDGNGQMMKM